MKSNILLLAGLMLLTMQTMSCKRSAANAGSGGDFESFYELFHQDSLYQMEHIAFPITGIPSFADEESADDPNFRWTQENWKIHKPFNFKDSEFKQSFRVIATDVVEETILHNRGQFAMIRRFALVGGEWNLIYFADMNPVKR
ncbi:MAG TPA: hypothetical protein PLL53_12840 [Saprospiraceae bacterium]|nr:hypothetical protein [Saprospiraceae bacterium]